ncbi:probable cytochrome P450 6a13 [Anabrus simplex]|uniref:probable cytochrome P450 6a13 n=1 Tax=Anabrus simplex TaxID=316456 RepID=UPI0035A377F4
MVLFFESILLDVLAAIGVLLPTLYVYFTWNFDYWEKKGAHFVKPTPFFGNIKDRILVRLSTGQWSKKLYDENEGHRYVGIFQMREPALLLRDPDLIKDVLVKDFQSFHDRGLPVDEKNQPLSAHLFNLPGPRWRALRAKLTPTFTSGKMKMMYQLMAECSEELRQHLKDPANRGEELEMREVMAQFTTDIIGSCAFGLQMNSMKNSESEFRRMGRKAFEPSLKSSLRRLVLLMLPPVAKILKLGFGDPEVAKFFLNAVKETVEYREKNNIIRNDFMNLLLQLKHKGEVEGDQDTTKEREEVGDKEKMDIKMTDNLLAAQAFVFFLAGFETSSTAMSFALYELALHPEIQSRLREEVDAVLKENEGNLTYDALQQMQYLDQVISETLRKYPPGDIIIRICTKAYTMPGTDIEIDKGTRILVPVLALHHDPKYYPDPERFDPERFNDANKHSRHHFVYLPFGEGPRNCIGMRFGLLQAKLGLATLLRDFQFTPCKRTAIPLRYDPKSIVTASKDGIYLKISPRD